MQLCMNYVTGQLEGMYHVCGIMAWRLVTRNLSTHTTWLQLVLSNSVLCPRFL